LFGQKFEVVSKSGCKLSCDSKSSVSTTPLPSTVLRFIAHLVIVVKVLILTLQKLVLGVNK